MTVPPPPGYPPQPSYGNALPPHGGPPPGQQPGYPPGHPGYLPPPAPTTARIPEDQPFVVRPNAAKRGALMLGLALVLLTPIACFAGLVLANSASPSANAKAPLGVVGMLVCLLAAVAAPLSFQLWLIASGGPVLALSPAGLWIRTRPTRGQAVWVPWEAVAQIRRRRWGVEKMLVVQLRDPRMMQNLGTFTALDSSTLTTFYGSNLVATLTFGDRSEQEILAAMTHFSAGRCPIAR